MLQWVRDGRVLKATLIRKDAEVAVPAEALPELAELFSTPSAKLSNAIPPMATAVTLPAEFRSWGFIGQAWELVKPNWLPLAAMALISCLMGAVPYLGGCVMFIIGGAIQVGVNRAILGMIAGRTPTVEMMFGGFDRFAQAFLAQLVVAILVGIGVVLLIVPGIILAIMWMFVNLVLAETELDFWEAMKRSADLTAGYRWNLFFLCLANVVVCILGLLACGLGILVAYPVVYTSVALAYRFLQARQGVKLA